jgi:pimeloyl-ACP methyl ester carboxylesterase
VLGFLDALDLNRVDLIGHSMGGLVACLLAQERPERVRELILEDIGAIRPRPPAALAQPAGELAYDWDMVLAIRGQIGNPDPAWWDRLSQSPRRRSSSAAARVAMFPRIRWPGWPGGSLAPAWKPFRPGTWSTPPSRLRSCGRPLRSCGPIHSLCLAGSSPALPHQPQWSQQPRSLEGGDGCRRGPALSGSFRTPM